MEERGNMSKLPIVKKIVKAVEIVGIILFMTGLVRQVHEQWVKMFGEGDVPTNQAESLLTVGLIHSEEEDSLLPPTPFVSADGRARIFTSYILSRFQGTALDNDPASPYIMPLAEYLHIPLEIRTAKNELNKAFPPELARAVEQLITGDVWTEAMDGPAHIG